jgi:hypothetical protein
MGLMSELRPVPSDPSAPIVEGFLEVDQSWLLGAAGEYDAFAAEVMTRTGQNWQRVIGLRWPARINKTDELVTLRLLISIEDAQGLADVLTRTANWYKALAQLEGLFDDQ